MEMQLQAYYEEIANAISHGVGLLFFLIAIPFLFIKNIRNYRRTKIVGTILYSIGLASVYTSSTLFHAIQAKGLKEVFHLLDHLSIFFLIAGTMTPVVLKYTSKKMSTFFLIKAWTIVVIGVCYKLFVTDQSKIISLGLYLGLGWTVVLIIKPLIQNMPKSIFWLVASGGLVYSLGTIFFVWETLPYAHMVWHLFVLTASILHFSAVYKSMAMVNPYYAKREN